MSSNKEGASKRQVRREEVRRKERQQRLVTVGIVVVVAAVLIGAIVIPSINNVRNPAVDFAMITPEAYTTANGTALGNPQAKVKIEIFEDYQCSACKTYAEYIEPQVVQTLAETNQVYYVFYEFPFMDDRMEEKASDLSANAAECASEQSKFWDYKKLLFANQRLGFTEDRLISYAKALALDTDQFKTCLTEKRYQSKIDQDIAVGEKYALTGTPTIIVNGKDVSPGRVPTYEQIFQAVQEAQAAAK